jgi:hypothetical protein
MLSPFVTLHAEPPPTPAELLRRQQDREYETQRMTAIVLAAHLKLRSAVEEMKRWQPATTR